MLHAASVFQLIGATPAKATTITRVIYDKGYHGSSRAKDNTLTPVQRSATEKCILFGLPDSSDHWLHLCPFRGLHMIRDSVMSALQTAVTDLRHQGPLKIELSFAYLSLLKGTNEPNRIWTANWSRQQIASLASSFDTDLLKGLKMRDLTAILIPLEGILAQGALSQWHCKVVSERTATMTLTHRQLTVVHTENTAPDLTVQLESSPSTKTQPTHPPLSRKKRRRDRVPRQRVPSEVHTTLAFPTLSRDVAKTLRVLQSTDNLARKRVRINGIPITGAHFRRICQYGKSEPVWWFDGDIIYAYLHLVQDRLPRIRVMSAVATTKILYGDLAGAAREFHGRDGAKHIGLYDWIFFVFNITDQRGNGLHWTLGGCHVADRIVSYYYYMRRYSHRTQHLQAMASFLEFVASTSTTHDDRPWQCVESGAEGMAWQYRTTPMTADRPSASWQMPSPPVSPSQS